MTGPDSSGPDDRNEWLAGYADGELDTETTRRVEDRLASDPAAADALRDQEQLSPANRELWDAAAPPDPPPDTWAAVSDRIAAACLPRSRHRTGRAWVAAGGVAAAVLVGWGVFAALGPRKADPPPTAALAPDDPLAGFAVLPIAGTGEAEVLAVRGDHPDGFLVGDHGLPDALALAGPGDVVLESAADPAVLTPPAAGDAPMIFARPR